MRKKYLHDISLSQKFFFSSFYEQGCKMGTGSAEEPQKRVRVNGSCSFWNDFCLNGSLRCQKVLDFLI